MCDLDALRPVSPTPSRRALIVGGSMAGLFTAILLLRQGWRVDVFERVGGELHGRGAGIVTHGRLFDVLAQAGIACAPDDLGIAVAGRRVFDRLGRLEGEVALPQTLTSWGRLYALLRAHLPAENYHTGRTLVAAEDGPDGVTVRFDDGSSAYGDLLVGADGLHSTVRGLLTPGVRPNYVGYVAWRGLVEEAALSDATRRDLCDHFSFSLPPGEQMLGYPVAGADESVMPGRRRFNFVWYRPAAAGDALGDLLTDDAGTRHEVSIPPVRIRPQVIAAMRADADRLLAPQFAEVVRLTAMPFLQAILDLEAPRMRVGVRTVLLGDAAFVARPHVGMGVTKAAADAAELADELARNPADVGTALHNFERTRLKSGAAVIRRARQLGAYMQAQILSPEERAVAERHRSPEAVMTETAVSTGLVA